LTPWEELDGRAGCHAAPNAPCCALTPGGAALTIRPGVSVWFFALSLLGAFALPASAAARYVYRCTCLENPQLRGIAKCYQGWERMTLTLTKTTAKAVLPAFTESFQVNGRYHPRQPRDQAFASFLPVQTP